MTTAATTTNNNRDTRLKELIETVETQQKIIRSLRENNDQLNKRVEQITQDYRSLSSFIAQARPQFANSIQAEQFHNIIHRESIEQNKLRQEQIEQDRMRRELDDQVRQKKKWEEDKALVPMIVQTYEDKLKANHAERDEHLQAIERFFNLTREQVKEYVEIEHTINESAAQHCFTTREEVTEVIGAGGEREQRKTGRTLYTCNSCNILFPSLKTAELHAFEDNISKDYHKQQALDRVHQIERETTAKLAIEYRREVEREAANVRRTRATKQLAQEHDARKRYEQDRRKTLPFVE